MPHPTSLLIDLLDDALSEEGYDVRLAGLGYHVSSDMKGIVLSFSGFNNKLDTLFQMVLRTLKSFNINEERLKITIEKVSTIYTRQTTS